MSELAKYGFIYVWFDCKHKRYYVGSHWGNPNDSYICSSDNMRHNYKNRPQDFKRRIVKRIYTNREDLLKEEQRWLNMVKPNEFGFRFYNINPKVHQQSWWVNDHTRKHISEKLKGNKNGCKPCSPEKAKNISEAKRKKFEERRAAGLSCYEGQALINITNGTNKGRPHSEEQKRHKGIKSKNWWSTPEGLAERARRAKQFKINNPNRKNRADAVLT